MSALYRLRSRPNADPPPAVTGRGAVSSPGLAVTAARIRARWRERLVASALVNHLIGLGLMARAMIRRHPVEARLTDLVVACRRVSAPPLRRILARQLRPWSEGAGAHVWRQRQLGWTRYSRELETRKLTTSLLLKGPGPDGEKGVLYSSFEYNWLRLLAHHDARRFLADYFLVGASSWSPPDYGVMLSFAGVSRDPVFLGVSNAVDMAAYGIVGSAVRPLPLMACDWINPEFYVPKDRHARDVDILMVANFSPFKRHVLLFRALRRMRRDLRVALIGIRAPDRGEKELRAEARQLGAYQDLEILNNVPIETVTDYQCRAKISLILTLREGSCVAVTESMFADTPVGMMRNAHIGGKAHINPETGMLLSEARLDRQLSRFLEASASYHPREWALRHITCHHASRMLNDTLRGYSREAGYPWTRDITPLCWRYVPSYVDPADEDRTAPELERLRERYGIELEKFQYRPRP